ncbi:hypothetical protein CDL15_Pgr010737 [Punica granatum]|uniref:Uncharacterized protein n=1 Tax=Punica granatum TaxID=22663 RepID=A0A218W5L1_PUNGR|nr:hypothetical protein CDL15_Pgr010737 [Punica granatum]
MILVQPPSPPASSWPNPRLPFNATVLRLAASTYPTTVRVPANLYVSFHRFPIVPVHGVVPRIVPFYIASHTFRLSSMSISKLLHFSRPEAA